MSGPACASAPTAQSSARKLSGEPTENVMRNTLLQSAMLAAAALTLGGCASQPRYAQSGHSDDGRYDSRYEQSRHDERCNQCGAIANIEQVWIDDRHVGGGTLLGVIIGGAIGNQVGSGDGRRAATAAGAIAGGVIGHEAEKNHRDQQRGYRIEVRLDDGRYGHVVQLQDPQLRIGDRVVIRDERVYALR
ncbi:MAG: glycine zipper 2TM domain-containing protein [Xanthomonadales bacterium]|jgi:outer membrane lipoprotein SlyB|nr:glycine zipper 2TM domain-containing protein [Xanthomonadales bacterium]MBP7622713.1 glycine zipper 2TM domain-containing protein [Xanthomonadales bacterium]